MVWYHANKWEAIVINNKISNKLLMANLLLVRKNKGSITSRGASTIAIM